MPADPILDYLPEFQVHLLVGAAGVGKTALLASFLMTLREGGQWLGYQLHKPPFIGLIVGDRVWADHQVWFERAGWPDIPHYSLTNDLAAGPLLEKSNQIVKGFPLLSRAAGTFGLLPPGSVLALDPLSLFIEIDPVKDGYRGTAHAMLRLGQWALAQQITIIGSYHAAKQKGDVKERYLRPQDRIIGSMAMIGFSGTQMFLMGPGETGQEHYDFSIHPHRVPEQTHHLIRDTQGLFVPFDPLTAERIKADAIYQLLPPDGSIIAFSALELRASQELRLKKVRIYFYLNLLIKDGRVVCPLRGKYRRAAVS